MVMVELCPPSEHGVHLIYEHNARLKLLSRSEDRLRQQGGVSYPLPQQQRGNDPYYGQVGLLRESLH